MLSQEELLLEECTSDVKSELTCKSSEDADSSDEVPDQIPGADVHEIRCGQLSGKLYMQRFTCPGIHRRCIEYEGKLISPRQFTIKAEKDKQKDWKGSIRLDKYNLRTLMEMKKLDFYEHATNCSLKCQSRNYIKNRKNEANADGSNNSYSLLESLVNENNNNHNNNSKLRQKMEISSFYDDIGSDNTSNKSSSRRGSSALEDYVTQTVRSVTRLGDFHLKVDDFVTPSTAAGNSMTVPTTISSTNGCCLSANQSPVVKINSNGDALCNSNNNNNNNDIFTIDLHNRLTQNNNDSAAKLSMLSSILSSSPTTSLANGNTILNNNNDIKMVNNNNTTSNVNGLSSNNNNFPQSNALVSSLSSNSTTATDLSNDAALVMLLQSIVDQQNQTPVRNGGGGGSLNVTPPGGGSGGLTSNLFSGLQQSPPSTSTASSAAAMNNLINSLLLSNNSSLSSSSSATGGSSLSKIQTPVSSNQQNYPPNMRSSSPFGGKPSIGQQHQQTVKPSSLSLASGPSLQDLIMAAAAVGNNNNNVTKPTIPPAPLQTNTFTNGSSGSLGSHHTLLNTQLNSSGNGMVMNSGGNGGSTNIGENGAPVNAAYIRKLMESSPVLFWSQMRELGILSDLLHTLSAAVENAKQFYHAATAGGVGETPAEEAAARQLSALANQLDLSAVFSEKIQSRRMHASMESTMILKELQAILELQRRTDEHRRKLENAKRKSQALEQLMKNGGGPNGNGGSDESGIEFKRIHLSN